MNVSGEWFGTFAGAMEGGRRSPSRGRPGKSSPDLVKLTERLRPKKLEESPGLEKVSRGMRK